MSERDLVTDEGVDEGSASSGTEDPRERPDPVGPPAHGDPDDASDPAPPDGTTSTDARGQTLEAGEG